ncbi:MAG: hypothetical protein LBS48_05140 [Treponema sp.]|nr:hypothetical protein [Treponema sp.]
MTHPPRYGNRPIRDRLKSGSPLGRCTLGFLLSLVIALAFTGCENLADSLPGQETGSYDPPQGTAVPAVLSNADGSYRCYYRNETLEDTASGSISATNTLPAESGLTEGNWTRR